MAPHELIALEACSSGIRVEMNASEVNSDHASRVLKECLQQKNELLAKEKLRQKHILEEVYRKHFPDVPLAIPPCQLPKQIPCKADPKRASVNMVFSRAIEACDGEKDATPMRMQFSFSRFDCVERTVPRPVRATSGAGVGKCTLLANAARLRQACSHAGWAVENQSHKGG